MYVKHREDIIIYDNNLGIHMRRFETGVTKLWQKNQNYSIFIEIVQYICNTTFLYRHVMVNRKKKKQNEKCKFPSILAAADVFLWPCINLISEHKNLSKICKVF